MKKRINEFLEKEFGKTITVKVPKREKKRIKSIYTWWRRFSTHKNLPYRSHYNQKIQNGDFDYSPYWEQLQYEYYWMAEEILELRDNHRGGKDSLFHLERDIITSYNKRIKKLSEDAIKDESERFLYLKNELALNFGGKNYTDEFLEKFNGTISEAFNKYPEWLKNKKTNKNYE